VAAVSRPPLHEEDLYGPVRDLLVSQGYVVRGEVRGVDVFGVRGSETLAVELKTSLNLDLLLQAVDRQRIADAVYVAVPRKGRTVGTRRWARLLHLLARLEIGLILVSPTTRTATVSVEAVPFDRARSREQGKRRRAALLQEFSGRTGDRNAGGVTRRPIYTAYREMALEVARLIAVEGPCKVRRLRELGADADKVMGILRNNHYGWFEHAGRDLYALTDRGRAEIAP
jgi:hypothetical protein